MFDVFRACQAGSRLRKASGYVRPGLQCLDTKRYFAPARYGDEGELNTNTIEFGLQFKSGHVTREIVRHDEGTVFECSGTGIAA